MKTIEIAGDLRVPMLTVRDMIEFTELAFQDERQSVIADLDASNAAPELRLQELREHSRRKGSAALLLLASFRLGIASQMVAAAIKRAGSDPDKIMSGLRPDQIVDLAKKLIGYEPSAESANPPEPVQATT